jgi:hypothetical protein
MDAVEGGGVIVAVLLRKARDGGVERGAVDLDLGGGGDMGGGLLRSRPVECGVGHALPP